MSLIQLLMSNVVGHIKKTDGFVGLYRGLVPRLISTYVNGLVSAAVADVSYTYCYCSVHLLLIMWIHVLKLVH